MKRYSGNLVFLRVVLALILPLYLVACGDNESHTTADSEFPLVVFSDIHFNPFYDPSLFPALVAADAGEWASIFQTSSITEPSSWGADSNYPLLVRALSSIKENLGASPLTIYTGDLLGHYLPQTFFKLYGSQSPPTAEDVAAMKAFTEKTVAFIMDQVRASVGNLPVMFAMGNADSYTGLGPDSGFLSATAELFYSQFLNGTVDRQTFLNTFTSGGYYSAEPAGMNLMVIGMNTFECSPYFGDATSDAVTAQLAWLDSMLASARDMGKKVWLLMHVPPGADKYTTAQSADAEGHITGATMLWNPDYQKRFLQILSKYPGVITMSLGAHTHMDEFRVMSPGNVIEGTPSIAPYFGNDPAFKVFTISRDTLKASDYTSLNYDLASNPGQFNSYYIFSTEYSMPGNLNDSLERLYPELATLNSKQELYRGHYFSGHNYTEPVGNTFYPITDTTWPVYWCGIGDMDEQSLIHSVNAY